MKIDNHYLTSGDWDANKLTEYFRIAINFYYLRPTLTLLIPIIGIFINKKIGWILIQSYFYFLISNFTFSAEYIDSTAIAHILGSIIIIIVLLLFIIIMNKKKIRNLIYGINKKELISKNIIASIIGISITIILVWVKAYGI